MLCGNARGCELLITQENVNINIRGKLTSEVSSDVGSTVSGAYSSMLIAERSLLQLLQAYRRHIQYMYVCMLAVRQTVRLSD